MERFYVGQLNESMIGEKVLVDANVKSATKRNATNGSTFLDVVLGDKEKEINAKIWNVSEDTANFVMSNQFIRTMSKVDSYKGTLQLVINKCGPIPEAELDESKLVKTAPESIEGLIREVEDSIEMIEDVAIKTIVSRRWIKNKDKFIIWPAAKSNHHNYRTGLLYHTASMLRLGKNNISQYPGKLDKDVVLGSIILHDMDKITEYSDPDQPQYTEYGSLMGHIFMSGAETYHEAKLLEEEYPEIDTSKVKYLIHAILAHHGKLEWGSPVKPATIEAEIVHQIDMMDSRMNMNY